MYLFVYFCKQIHSMVKINEALSKKYLQQKDGIYAPDEEERLCIIAQSYAVCENSIVVLSNMRTNTSQIFFGRSCEILGLDRTDSHHSIDSAWEEELYSYIHPKDMERLNLQELVFFRMVASLHNNDTFSWYLEHYIRMRDTNNKYRIWRHRIFYFPSEGHAGICYSLCVYNIAAEESEGAYLINTMTGEKKILVFDDYNILTDREKMILNMISNGKSSIKIAEELGISKHTIDRHRQNIIFKLQVNNTTEACNKARKLGIIN